jgi:hypothetical protein
VWYSLDRFSQFTVISSRVIPIDFKMLLSARRECAVAISHSWSIKKKRPTIENESWKFLRPARIVILYLEEAWVQTKCHCGKD